MTFTRERHRIVATALAALDDTFLTETHCYFGGGTRIVLELGEYRESADIDFLCADQNGYRALRNTIGDQTLGKILSTPLPLAREVRADLYGIRTFVEVDDWKIKLEIINEGRIELASAFIPGLLIPCLDAPCCFAEKFLANADRGNDTAFASRDVVDLAFMMATWPGTAARGGLATAEKAYGDIVITNLDRAIARLLDDPRYLRQCAKTLLVNDEATLAKGLTALARKRWRSS